MFHVGNSSTIYVSQTIGNHSHYNGLSSKTDLYGNGPFQTMEQALKAVGEMRLT